MTRSIRRSLLASIALLGAGCGPEEKCAPIDPKSIQIELGTGGLWCDCRWNRVLVKARTEGSVFRGEVEVSGIEGDGQPSREKYRKRFEVAGESQSIEVPACPTNWLNLVVTFRGAGIPEVSAVRRISWDPSVKFRILVIGKPRPAALPRAFPEVLACVRKEIEVKDVSPRSLPGHFLAYRSADLVIADTTSLLDMDPDRFQSIREWVERGGAFVVVPSPGWRCQLPVRESELCGLRSAECREETLGGEPEPAPEAEEEEEQEPPEKKFEEQAQLFRLVPLPGARLRADGLLLEHRFGNGSCYFHAFGPSRIFSRKSSCPPGVARAWKQIAERVAGRRRESSQLEEEFEPSAIQRLSGFSGLRYPSRGKTILMVVVYVTVALVLSGLIFGRRRKLERAYIAAALLSILTCVGIWRFGVLFGIQDFGIDEITVARIRPGTSVADSRTYVGLSSPGNRSFKPLEVDLPRGSIPSQPTQTMFPMDYRVSGQDFQISEIPLLANAIRFLRFDGTLDLAGKIEAATATGPNGNPVLGVRNSLPFSLTLHFISCSSPEDPAPRYRVFGLNGIEAGGARDFELLLPIIDFTYEKRTTAVRTRSWDLVYILINSLLFSGSRSSFLIAVPENPPSISTFLGPARHSVVFFVLEVDGAHGP
jgi:hypothetical protein